MRVFKRILGIIGVLLGAVGVLVAIAQIIGIWFVNPPVTRSLQDLSGGLQSGLVAANQAIGRVDGLVQGVRTELQVPPDRREELSDSFQSSVTAIDATLQGASSTVQTMQTLFGATGRVPLVGGNEDQSALVEALDRAEQTMEMANSSLANLEQEAATLAEASAQTVSEIDTELEAVQNELAGLQAQLDEAQGTLGRVQARLPWWIDLGSIGLTLIFFWYGVAQWCLLYLSWRWVRQPG